MKHKWLLLLLLPVHVMAGELELKTSIKDVTVFQTGAQVTRNGITSVPAGESEIHLKDIPPGLKRESIQVRSNAEITLLSVSFETITNDVEPDREKNKLLEKKKEEYEIRLEDMLARFSILQAEEQIISNLQQVSTTSTGVNVDQIVKAQEIMRTKMNLIITEQLTLKRKIKDQQESLREVSQQISVLNGTKQTLSNDIVIRVSAKQETRADFSVSYIMPNARWIPAYDIRVKNVGEPMQIEYKAQVQQHTGEDWSKVKLKLSTGDPSLGSKKPSIVPWYINLNQPYQQPQQQSNFYKYTDAKFTKVSGRVFDAENGEALFAASVIATGTNIGVSTDFDGKFSLTLPENASSLTVKYIGYNDQVIALTASEFNIYLKPSVVELAEVVVMQESARGRDNHSAQSISYNSVGSKSSGTTVTREDIRATAVRGSRSAASMPQVQPQLNIVSTEFVITESYSIPSGQKPVSVTIQTVQTPAHYQYYCAPRLDKDVFLTAQIVDWEQYNFLEGNANVFFEGTFVGNTLMETKYLSDTLNISLGRDKSVKVERKKSKEYTKRQIMGGDQFTYRHWDFTVRNGKSQKINIILEDQFPLAANSSIEIRREEKSGGDLNEETGIVTWKFDLDPQKNKELKLRYSVKHPKGTFVGLD